MSILYACSSIQLLTGCAGSGGGGTILDTGGGDNSPAVEVLNGADGFTTINVNDKISSMSYGSNVGLGQVTSPVAASATAQVVATSGATTITSAAETFSTGSRYLLLVAADKFGSALVSYKFENNAYPPSGSEWITCFNGVPDFISAMDVYVLGPGQTVKNSSPAIPNMDPLVGYQAKIPATLGKFTVAYTYAGEKELIATSAVQTSGGGISLIADLHNPANTGNYAVLITQEPGQGSEASLIQSRLGSQAVGSLKR